MATRSNPMRRAFAALLVLCGMLALSPAPARTADGNPFALIFLPEKDSQPLLMRELKINGKEKVHTFGPKQPAPTLVKSAYKKLPETFPNRFRRILIDGGWMTGETAEGERTVLLPREIKTWPKNDSTAVKLTELLSDVRFEGKLADTGKKQRGRLRDGMAIYFFAAQPLPDAIAFARAELIGTLVAYEKFHADFPDSPHVVPVREILAAEYLTVAAKNLDAYEEALAERTRGYGKLEEARQWLARVRALGATNPGLAAADGRWKNQTAHLDRLLQEARSALESNGFEHALEVLDPIAHFEPEFPKLASELAAIKEAAFSHHMQQAETLSLQREFDAALAAVEAATKWGPAPETDAMRAKIGARRAEHERANNLATVYEQSDDAFATKDFLTALKILRPAILRFPDEAALQERLTTARRELRGQLLTRAPEVERVYTPLKEGDLAGEKQVLEVYLGLNELVESAPNDAEIAYWRDTMRDYLAEHYHTRAKSLVPSQGGTPTPLAYAFLQQAYTLAPEGSRRDITEMASWRPVVEDDLGIQLALNVQDSTPDFSARAAAIQLRRLLIIGLQKAELPHFEILGARAVPAQGPDHALELRVDISRASVDDDRKTENIHSEYTAGTKQVLNSEWERAKIDYDAAVERYEKLRVADTEKMKKKQRQDHQQQLDAALVEMNTARSKLDTTPVYSQQEDIRPYQFTRSEVTRTASVEIAYQWILEGVLLKTEIASHSESAAGVEVKGVERDDRNQHRNQDADLPDGPELLSRTLGAMQGPLSETFREYLKAFIGRDFNQGELFASQNEPERAAEHYLRFLFNADPKDPRREQAKQYLRGRFNLVTLDSWLDVR